MKKIILDFIPEEETKLTSALSNDALFTAP